MNAKHPKFLFLTILVAPVCAVEDWQYKLMSDITRIENISQGNWDHGIDPRMVESFGKGSKALDAKTKDFISRHLGKLENRKTGLALYLSIFRFSDTEDLWAKLIAMTNQNDEMNIKHKVRIGPLKSDGVISVSIRELYSVAKARHGRPPTGPGLAR
jgi:hypothetical protein